MKHTVHALFAAGFLTLGSIHLNAQEVIADFENIDLQGTDTTLMMSNLPNDGDYFFESEDIRLFSNISWGSMISGFDCSNVTNPSYNDYGKPLSVKPLSGAEGSENYVIGFVDVDFMGPDPSVTIPIGAKILNNSAGKPVLGLSVTNTTIAYNYILDKYNATNEYYFKLVIKGYLNEVESTDSVIYTLADFSVNPPILNEDWEFVDLTSLGDVDSLTFDLRSNDDEGGYGINTPAYFGIDNIITGEEEEEEEPPSSIAGLDKNSGFSIHPNPTSDILNITSDKNVNLQVTNILGQVLITENNTQSIDVRHLPNGVYLLNVSNSDYTNQTIRFIKK